MNILALAILAAFLAFLRSLHLFNNSGHYYLLTPDSYFFHWLAERIMNGQGLPPDAPADAIYALHSGLAYPLAYLGSLADGESGLDLVCKILPIVLGLIGMVIFYFIGARIFNRGVGLFAAFTWVTMMHTSLVTTAGFIDRDALSMLLITGGAALFYFSCGWRYKVGRWDIGWLLVGIGIVAIEAILYLEWVFIGPVLLFAILTANVIGGSIAQYVVLDKGKKVWRRIRQAVENVNWRSFSLVFLINMIVLIVGSALSAGGESIFASLGNLAEALGAKADETAGIVATEMQRVTLGDILAGYHLFLIPLIVGIVQVIKNPTRGGIFFLCWFVVILVLSVFSKRVLLYAAPAAVVLSAIGLAFLWDWMSSGGVKFLKKTGVVALIGLILILSTAVAATVDSAGTTTSPDADWQEAMAYLRTQTPEESKIMALWSYGYWILDLGERRPLTDNGLYDYTREKLEDTALTYHITDPEEIVQLLLKHGCDYLIFAEQDFLSETTYIGWDTEERGKKALPEDAISVRSLAGDFTSENGLAVRYRDADGGIVILGLEEQ